MFISQTNKRIGVFALGLLALAGLCVSLSYAGVASADAPVFLTRQGGVMSTYPNNVAFSIGTTTAAGQMASTTVGKLNVTLRANEAFLGAARDGFRKAFQVASTTTAGGTATSTADIFAIRDTGCINTVATSSATPVKLNFLTVATTSANGFVTWSYGLCP